MVAVAGTHPSDTGTPGFFNGDVHSVRHDQVAHAVVAVDDGHSGALSHDPNVGTRIDAARQNTFDILRQANNAVAVRTLQVGIGHEARDFGGVLIGQSGAFQGVGDEGAELVSADQYG